MIGGPVVAARVCGVSKRAVYKWLKSGRLPSTAYSGISPYAEKLSNHEKALFTAEWLLDRKARKAA